MATLTEYKGLDVVENATGEGGMALTENFKELADRAPYQAAGNPGVNDDSTKGFAPGDTWMNSSTQVLWSCVSNGTAAAVWKSILKRTATALELIPQETGEGVVVDGALQTSGRLGVQRAASTCPLEVQQDAGDTVMGCRVLNSAATQGAELGVTSGGTVLLRRANTTSPVLVISSYFRLQGGNLGIGGGTLQPTAPLDIENDRLRIRTTKTPASANDTGNQGDICWDSGYVYVCVAANTWKRAALASW